MKKLLILTLCFFHFGLSSAFAAEGALEEGKALYETGQYMAALSKFMIVLRQDPHQAEARRYLRMVIEVMRKSPTKVASKDSLAAQAAVPSAVVQQEVLQAQKKRGLLSMDLRAIPQVAVDMGQNSARVEIESSLLFSDKSSGLKETGVPVLDRAAAWLKTFGQQPIIIHCYPEETEDPATNGSLFLKRYSELYNFFVEEKHLVPSRFVSADLLQPETPKEKDQPETSLRRKRVEMKEKAEPVVEELVISSGSPRVIIETIGSYGTALDASGAGSAGVALPRWLEFSILHGKTRFNPEEGEWASMDLVALTRTGLRKWFFTIEPAREKRGKTKEAVKSLKGLGNLLQRVSWDGHDERTGSFVPAGDYLCKLTAIDSEGTSKTQEILMTVVRSSPDESVVVRRTPRKAKKPVPVVAKKTAPKPVAVQEPVAPIKKGSTDETPSEEPNVLTPKEEQAAEAPPPPPESETTAEEDDNAVRAIWKQVVQFDLNQSEMKPTVKASLERIGKTLEVYPLQKVRITGFADTSETNASELAKERAEKVREMLVQEYRVDLRKVIVAGGKVGPGGPKVELSITN